MSHPVNDELLERLYEEVQEEYPDLWTSELDAIVMQRFEDMSM
tara:strand:+ start:81 stop:209 length:129 start_codon:yes stop_codon:yes gene_type:complete